MTDLTTIRAALEESFDALEALGADLTSAEWEASSLCPDWTVRGVFEHLVGIENALVSWVPDAANTPPPFGLAGTFAKEVAGLDAPAFMECVRDVLARRRQDLSVLGPSDLAQPSLDTRRPGNLRPVHGNTGLRFLGPRTRHQHPACSLDRRHGSTGRTRTGRSRRLARLHRRQESGTARRSEASCSI